MVVGMREHAHHHAQSQAEEPEQSPRRGLGPDHGSHGDHAHADQRPHADHGDASWGTAVSATLHCLTGCAIGEVLGMVLATWWGWSNGASIALAIALAFVFGYALTASSVL